MKIGRANPCPPRSDNQDGAKIVHIRASRTGYEQIIKRRKCGTTVISCQTLFDHDALGQKSCRRGPICKGPGIVADAVNTIRVGGKRVDACLPRYASGKGKQEFRVAPPCPVSAQCDRGFAPGEKQDGLGKGAIAARNLQSQIGMETPGFPCFTLDGIRKNDGLDCRFSGPVIGARTWSEFLETGNQII